MWLRTFSAFLVVAACLHRHNACFVPQESAEAAPPGFSLASYFTSQMVLQSSPQSAVVWGYAATSDIGQVVTVTLEGTAGHREYKATVQQGPDASRAVWRVTLDPVDQGGPYLISAVLSAYQPLAIKDVLFGDVWLCSGQSNMEFQMYKMFGNSKELLTDTTYDDIRMLNTPCVEDSQPHFDFVGGGVNWTKPELGSDSWASFSAVCFMFGKYLNEKLQRPIGLIDDSWGGTPLESWSSGQALQKCGLENEEITAAEYQSLQGDDEYTFQEKRPHPHQNSVLWNGMVHPLLNMTIKGVIWYQGEANTGYHTDQYSCSFPAMITDWRDQFNVGTGGQVPLDMPFGFVQIGPNTDPSRGLGYPEIRWHQMGDDVTKLPLPNTFMAVAMDLTDPVSPFGVVHIRDKNTVAQRLSRAALTSVYGKGYDIFTYPRPTFEEILPASKQMLVQFGNDKIPINVRTYDGFEVCCGDSYSKCPTNSTENWFPAPIIGTNATTILLSWKECSTSMIAAYRYAWKETPCSYHQCAIYSDFSGDPLPTFTRPFKQILEERKDELEHKVFLSNWNQVLL